MLAAGGLSASIGIGENKLQAKIAARHDKELDALGIALVGELASPEPAVLLPVFRAADGRVAPAHRTSPWP